MSKDLYIIGTGGLAREIAAALPQSNLCDYHFVGFISENSDEIGAYYSGCQVVGSDDNLPFSDGEVSIIVGIGHPYVREKVVEKYLKLKNCDFPNMFDSSSRVSNSLKIGMGNLVLFNSFISVDVIIGDFNLFNWFTTLGHDSKVGNSCIINPHAHLSGYSSIGDNVLIGAGAKVLENCSISSGCLIGAGAVVTKNILDIGTYVGVPAKVKNENRN